MIKERIATYSSLIQPSTSNERGVARGTLAGDEAGSRSTVIRLETWLFLSHLVSDQPNGSVGAEHWLGWCYPSFERTEAGSAEFDRTAGIVG